MKMVRMLIKKAMMLMMKVTMKVWKASNHRTSIAGDNARFEGRALKTLCGRRGD